CVGGARRGSWCRERDGREGRAHGARQPLDGREVTSGGAESCPTVELRVDGNDLPVLQLHDGYPQRAGLAIVAITQHLPVESVRRWCVPRILPVVALPHQVGDEDLPVRWRTDVDVGHRIMEGG